MRRTRPELLALALALGPGAAAAQPAAEAVDPALLEFLAQWTGGDGRWVDPGPWLGEGEAGEEGGGEAPRAVSEEADDEQGD